MHPLLGGELGGTGRIQQVIIRQVRFVELVEGEHNEVVLQVRTNTYREISVATVLPTSTRVPLRSTAQSRRTSPRCSRGPIPECMSSTGLLYAPAEMTISRRARRTCFVGGSTLQDRSSTSTATARSGADGETRERMIRSAWVEVRTVRLGGEVAPERKSALVGRGG